MVKLDGFQDRKLLFLLLKQKRTEFMLYGLMLFSYPAQYSKVRALAVLPYPNGCSLPERF